MLYINLIIYIIISKILDMRIEDVADGEIIKRRKQREE